MPKRRSPSKTRRGTPLPASPLSADEWTELVQILELSPQQAKIVDLILRGCKDKQIAGELGLGFSTVRTYLDRIFAHLGVSDRVGLVLHIFHLYSRRSGRERCP